MQAGNGRKASLSGMWASRAPLQVLGTRQEQYRVLRCYGRCLRTILTALHAGTACRQARPTQASSRPHAGGKPSPALVVEAHVELGVHLVAAADHAQVRIAVEHDAHLRRHAPARRRSLRCAGGSTREPGGTRKRSADNNALLLPRCRADQAGAGACGNLGGAQLLALSLSQAPARAAPLPAQCTERARAWQP